MNMEVGSIEFVWKGVKSFPIREEAQRLKTPQKSAPVPQRSPSPFNQSAADEDEPDIEEVLRVHRAVSDLYTPGQHFPPTTAGQFNQFNTNYFDGSAVQNTLAKYLPQQQSKLADEMLLMTRQLKNISTVARDIIVKDNSGT